MTQCLSVPGVRWIVPATLAFASAAGAQTISEAGSPDPAASEFGQASVILEPSQGRPVIVRPDDSFRLLMRIGGAMEETVTPMLRHRRARNLMTPLQVKEPLTYLEENHGSLTLTVSTKTPAGLYDLMVKIGDHILTARSSVKVVQAFKTQFRFVHLSDMTIGDPSAPAFDRQLVEEINLIAPEFIVATGDFQAWGRALDDADTWTDTLDFLAEFDAPVYVVCGDNDHPSGCFQYFAQSPVGTFDYGRYHGILLLEHAHSPIDQEQIDFIRSDLDRHMDSMFSMIVKHDDGLALLDQLASPELLADCLRERKVRMIICGGSDDWRREENAARLKGLDLHYIRTHQASTCLRGRATGVSHYRIIEVDGERVSYVYPAEEAGEEIDHSVPVGRLRMFPRNTGSQREVVDVQNALNQAFKEARVWIPVAKNGPEPPQIAGGRLVQSFDIGRRWLCEVSVDLPDKGGVRVMAASDGDPPPALPLKSAYHGDTELVFHEEHNEAGLAYYRSGQSISITLKNDGTASQRVYPAVRLNGTILPLTADGRSEWPISIEAGDQVDLVPKLILGRCSPGEHLMQLVFLNDPVRRVTTFPVLLRRQ